MNTASDRDRDRLMRANAWKPLLIGGIAAAIGLVVMLLAPGRGAGVAIASLATAPTVAGLGLLLSSRVAARAGEDKPFS